MALDRNKIHRALATHLNDNFASASNVVWENTKKVFNVTDAWFEETFIPNDSRQATIMKDGYIEDFGIYRINTRVPIETGTIDSDAYIETLSKLYKPGTIITKEGLDIEITKATPSQGIPQDNWYVVPLSIYWSCYMTLN